jgi:ssDNA-specific exonuclease RecJ
MPNIYLATAHAIKPLAFALPTHFARLYTTIFPSQPKDIDTEQNRLNAALCLQRMANEMESVQPSLAAELRSFASRS